MIYPVCGHLRLVGCGLGRKTFEKPIDPFLDDWPRSWLAHVLQALEEAKYFMSAPRDLDKSQDFLKHTELL